MIRRRKKGTFKKVLLSLFFLLVAAIIALNFISFDRYKEPITKQIYEKTGFYIALNGPINLRITTGLSVRLHDFVLAPTDKPDMAPWKFEGEALSVKVNLIKLIWGTVAVDRVTVKEGKVTLLNEKNKKPTIIQNINITGRVDSQTGPFAFEGGARYENMEGEGRVEVQSIQTFPSAFSASLKPTINGESYAVVDVKGSLKSLSAGTFSLESKELTLPYIFTLPGKRVDLKKGLNIKGDFDATLEKAGPAVNIKALDLALESLALHIKGQVKPTEFNLTTNLEEGSKHATLKVTGQIQSKGMTANLSLESDKPQFLLEWLGLEKYKLDNIRSVSTQILSHGDIYEVHGLTVKETSVSREVPITLVYDGVHIKLNLDKFAYAEGAISTNTTYALGSKEFSSNFTVSNIDISPLAAEHFQMVKKGRLSANGNVKGLIQGDTTKNTLTGPITITVDGAEVDTFDIKHFMENLNKVRNIGDVPNLLNGLKQKAITHIKHAKIHVEWNVGVGRVDELLVNTDAADVKGSGTINLAQWHMEMATSIKPLQGPISEVPLVIEGPLDNPNYKIDVNALSKIMSEVMLKRSVDKVKQEVQKKAGTQIQEAIGGVLGGSKEGNAANSNINPSKILKSILG